MLKLYKQLKQFSPMEVYLYADNTLLFVKYEMELRAYTVIRWFDAILTLNSLKTNITNVGSSLSKHCVQNSYMNRDDPLYLFGN